MESSIINRISSWVEPVGGSKASACEPPALTNIVLKLPEDFSTCGCFRSRVSLDRAGLAFV
jgi:hypothetical protein